jgi:hypothetical protein
MHLINTMLGITDDYNVLRKRGKCNRHRVSGGESRIAKWRRAQTSFRPRPKKSQIGQHLARRRVVGVEIAVEENDSHGLIIVATRLWQRVCRGSAFAVGAAPSPRTVP